MSAKSHTSSILLLQGVSENDPDIGADRLRFVVFGIVNLILKRDKRDVLLSRFRVTIVIAVIWSVIERPGQLRAKGPT